MSTERTIRQRHSIRLKGYDYSKPGAYFVTVCTRNKSLLFHNDQLQKIAIKCWSELPEHFANIELDEWVLMPNHLHGIVIIGDATRKGVQLNAPTKESSINRSESMRSNHYSEISPKTGSLGVIVRTFKAMVTKISRNSGMDFFEWQRGYFDRIIRNDQELERIRTYIVNNPLQWELDEYYYE